MTWHTNNKNFDLSTYLQGVAVGSSQISYSDTELSEPVKLNPIQEKSYSPDSETDSCQSSQSGMTSAHSTDTLGADQLTFFAEDFPAPICLRQEQIITSTGHSEDLMGKSRDCGLKWLESLKKCNLRLSLSKTPQILEEKDSQEFLTTLGAWGIMQDGVCWAAKTLEPIITESECGYLPTPTSHNSKEGAYPAEFTRKTPTLSAQVGGKINPQWNELRMGFPLDWTKIGERGLR